MKKSVILISICTLLLVFAITPAFAADIKNVETNLPEISVEIYNGNESAGNIDLASVKASIDDIPLTAINASDNSKSTEWIIIADTSISVSNEHFTAEKAAIVSLLDSLGENDKLSVYTFDTGFEKITDNTSENAKEKINSIICTGQDTDLYAAISKSIDLAKESQSDNCYIVIYSDGIDTISKIKKEEIITKMKESGTPVYGLCASALDKKTSDAFNDLLKNSGGKAVSFSTENAFDKLGKINKSKTITVNLKAEENIPANQNATLKIDLGDGKELSYETPVEEWSKAPETTTEAENTTTQKNTSENGLFDSLPLPLPVIAAAAALIIIAIIVLLILKNKKSKPDKPKKKETIKNNKSVSSDEEINPADNNTSTIDVFTADNKKGKGKKEKSDSDKKPKKSKKEESPKEEFQFYFEKK